MLSDHLIMDSQKKCLKKSVGFDCIELWCDRYTRQMLRRHYRGSSGRDWWCVNPKRNWNTREQVFIADAHHELHITHHTQV